MFRSLIEAYPGPSRIQPGRHARRATVLAILCKAGLSLAHVVTGEEWSEIAGAPFNREIEVAIVSAGIGTPTAICRRIQDQWIDIHTCEPLTFTPSHWRRASPFYPPVSCCG